MEFAIKKKNLELDRFLLQQFDKIKIKNNRTWSFLISDLILYIYIRILLLFPKLRCMRNCPALFLILIIYSSYTRTNNSSSFHSSCKNKVVCFLRKILNYLYYFFNLLFSTSDFNFTQFVTRERNLRLKTYIIIIYYFNACQQVNPSGISSLTNQTRYLLRWNAHSFIN